MRQFIVLTECFEWDDEIGPDRRVIVPVDNIAHINEYPIPESTVPIMSVGIGPFLSKSKPATIAT